MSKRLGIGRLLALAALTLAVLLSVAPVASEAGASAPASIVATVRIKGVTCGGPCCCGYGATTYQGHLYDTGPAGYCRWFRPLRNGQLVTTRLWLVR